MALQDGGGKKILFYLKLSHHPESCLHIFNCSDCLKTNEKKNNASSFILPISYL